MKKGQIIEGMVECVEFPNKGIVRTEDGGRVIVKNAVPGQKVSASINKVRRGKCEGRLLEVLERSAKEQPEAACIHAGECGGCTYQTLPYEEQLAMKASQVKKLIDDVIVPENTDYEFLGIKASPRQQEYRNKMEFSFGDSCKDGPLSANSIFTPIPPMQKQYGFSTACKNRSIRSSRGREVSKAIPLTSGRDSGATAPMSTLFICSSSFAVNLTVKPPYQK